MSGREFGSLNVNCQSMNHRKWWRLHLEHLPKIGLPNCFLESDSHSWGLLSIFLTSRTYDRNSWATSLRHLQIVHVVRFLRGNVKWLTNIFFIFGIKNIYRCFFFSILFLFVTKEVNSEVSVASRWLSYLQYTSSERPST